MLNPDTRIAVVGYSGDQKQIEQSLDLYLHHECPVTILSPEDAPVVINHPSVDNRHAGGRAHYGPVACARMLAHLKILLTYPENFFFMNESDSLCLDPKIPNYLYRDADTVWSNGGPCMPYNAVKLTGGCPALSFQAPWFFSRKTIEAFVSVADRVLIPMPADEKDRAAYEWWVDLYLVQLTHAAKLRYDFYLDRYLGPISGRYDESTGIMVDPMPNTTDLGRGRIFDLSAPLVPYDKALTKIYAKGLENALGAARNGACMIHSVKNSIASKALLAAYKRKS